MLTFRAYTYGEERARALKREEASIREGSVSFRQRVSCRQMLISPVEEIAAPPTLYFLKEARQTRLMDIGSMGMRM